MKTTCWHRQPQVLPLAPRPCPSATVALALAWEDQALASQLRASAAHAPQPDAGVALRAAMLRNRVPSSMPMPSSSMQRRAFHEEHLKRVVDRAEECVAPLLPTHVHCQAHLALPCPAVT